ncbi:MAG: hypothetical protein AB7U95_38000, partial [Reyranella sp.]
DTKRYAWQDIDCRQSRIVAWAGLKCRATNLVTGEGNVGAFRQWAAFGAGSNGYYVHMFVWEARNTYSYVVADETTADFVKWMFEDGKFVTRISQVARYKDADYVTFQEDKQGRSCVGFRRLGQFQRGGYDSVTGGILCAPPGKGVPDNDIFLFIDNVRLQPAAG